MDSIWKISLLLALMRINGALFTVNSLKNSNRLNSNPEGYVTREMTTPLDGQGTCAKTIWQNVCDTYLCSSSQGFYVGPVHWRCASQSEDCQPTGNKSLLKVIIRPKYDSDLLWRAHYFHQEQQWADGSVQWPLYNDRFDQGCSNLPRKRRQLEM